MKIKCTAPISMDDYMGRSLYVGEVDEVIDIPEDHALRWIRRNKAVEYVAESPDAAADAEPPATGKSRKDVKGS